MTSRQVNLDVPWWASAAINRVETFLSERPDHRVFERGFGARTLWLAQWAGSVNTVEHSARWTDIVGQQLTTVRPVDLRVIVPKPVGHNLSVKNGTQKLDFSDYARATDDEEPFEPSMAACRPTFDNFFRNRGLATALYRVRAHALPYAVKATILGHAFG